MFILYRWNFLVNTISLSGGIIVTGDPVFTMIFFCGVIFHGNMVCSVGYVFFFGYFVSRLVGITFFGLFKFRNFFISCCLWCSSLQIFAKCDLFFQSWHFDSGAEFLWLGFQFGAWQYLQFCSLGLSSGLVPFFPVFVPLSVASSSISFPGFDITYSGILLFKFFLSYVFCCIC